MTIEYDGANFCGWQIQKNGERTVQEELEKACARIFKHRVHVVGSGRTDSGVHAAGQVVSFKAETRMNPLEIQKALHSRMPNDIAILEVKEVPADFHAQYSVREKTYRYTILNRAHRSAFLRQHAYFYPYPLNMIRMRQAARFLTGRHDFRSFQAHDPLRAERGTVRTIRQITIRKEKDLIHIDITANGFLYKMVRNISGTLIAIGSGQVPLENIATILKAKSRSAARDTAPAHGLCLLRVKY